MTTAAVVAVLAGGRGRRLGGAKPVAELGGRPLIAWPLAAARDAGLEAVVVAKADTPLPSDLDVPVWTEPDEPSHPLAGLVHALEQADGRAVVAVACDMPHVSAGLLKRLCAADGAVAARADQPFPARYEPSALPVLRDALAREAPAREALAALAPAVLGAPAEELQGVNSPAELAAAAARVGRVPPSAEHWIDAFAAAIGRPAPTAEERETVLKLASVAAHASERRAAPIACWLAAGSDVSLDEAVVLAQELSGGPDIPDP